MNFDNIRDAIGSLIGKRLIDITQHAYDEMVDGKGYYVMLMFEDGSYLKFPVDSGRGFENNVAGEDE